MKLTEKTKKRFTIDGLSVVSIALVIAIASQFRAEVPKDTEVLPTPAVSSEVSPSVNVPPSSAEPTSTPTVSIKPIEETVTPSVTEKDTGKSTGTEQKIQAEPTKPPAPTESPKPSKPKAETSKPKAETSTKQNETMTKNPTKPPEYKPEDTVKTKPKEPDAGAKNDKGQMWVPGFGWVDDSGPNVGKEVDGEGDIDKQVGEMD